MRHQAVDLAGIRCACGICLHTLVLETLFCSTLPCEACAAVLSVDGQHSGTHVHALHAPELRSLIFRYRGFSSNGSLASLGRAT